MKNGGHEHSCPPPIFAPGTQRNGTSKKEKNHVVFKKKKILQNALEVSLLNDLVYIVREGAGVPLGAVAVVRVVQANIPSLYRIHRS